MAITGNDIVVTRSVVDYRYRLKSLPEMGDSMKLKNDNGNNCPNTCVQISLPVKRIFVYHTPNFGNDFANVVTRHDRQK